MRVFVHWNLHRDTYTIKDARTGLVIGYSDDLIVQEADFVVRKAGKEKTRQECRKNVHAGVRGELLKQKGSRVGTLVTYNPYLHDSFVTKRNEEPIYAAKTVVMTTVLVKRDGKLKKVPRVYARGGLVMHT